MATTQQPLFEIGQRIYIQVLAKTTENVRGKWTYAGVDDKMWCGNTQMHRVECIEADPETPYQSHQLYFVHPARLSPSSWELSRQPAQQQLFSSSSPSKSQKRKQKTA